MPSTQGSVGAVIGVDRANQRLLELPPTTHRNLELTQTLRRRRAICCR
jgi:hypothetical protein